MTSGVVNCSFIFYNPYDIGTVSVSFRSLSFSRVALVLSILEIKNQLNKCLKIRSTRAASLICDYFLRLMAFLPNMIPISSCVRVSYNVSVAHFSFFIVEKNKIILVSNDKRLGDGIKGQPTYPIHSNKASGFRSNPFLPQRQSFLIFMFCVVVV